MAQLETLHPKETADDCILFEGDVDVFTLAGLDDDWESISPKASPTAGQGHPILDNDEPCSVSLCLDAPLTDFLYHGNDRSDFSQYHGHDAVLDQPMLDLDSDDDEIDREEIVLDF